MRDARTDMKSEKSPSEQRIENKMKVNEFWGARTAASLSKVMMGWEQMNFQRKKNFNGKNLSKWITNEKETNAARAASTHTKT